MGRWNSYRLSKETEIKKIVFMEKYRCMICGFIYDPAEGDPAGGVDPGIAFSELPADYICPVCGAGKDEFLPFS